MGYKSIYCRYVKLIFDFIISFLFLIFFCWLYLIIFIAIKVEDIHSPAIFCQDRIGKHGKVYKMYKFRSMYVGSESKGSGVYSNHSDERITKVGLFLRKTSLDELPQFWNILKGDMSLIGYRSPLTYHPWKWEEYNDDQKIMFNVRPGMTGWAQVHGRRSLKWDDRFKYNKWYVHNVTLWLDIKIIFMTIWRLIKRDGNENLEKSL